MQALISSDKVKELLPQKYPMAMVHDLWEHTEDEVYTGFKVEAENIFCEEGVLSESGLIENFAQSVALHTSYDFYIREEEAPVGYIGSISNLKIMEFPKQGQVIYTRIKIIKEFMGITLVEGSIECEGRTLMTGKMKTFIAGGEVD